MLWRSGPDGSSRAVACSLAPFLPARAALPPSFPSALGLFCANQSERLRVKFDGLHAALEHAADRCPRLTGGDQIKKPLVSRKLPMQAFTVEQVRAARAFLGWSQRELGEASGLSYETIRNFENSRNSATPQTLAAMRNAFQKIRRRIPPAGQADRRDYYAAVATVVLTMR